MFPAGSGSENAVQKKELKRHISHSGVGFSKCLAPHGVLFFFNRISFSVPFGLMEV